MPTPATRPPRAADPDSNEGNAANVGAPALSRRPTPPRLEALEGRTLMSRSFAGGADNDLAYDAQGNLHVTYYDTFSHSLQYVRQSPGGAWSDPATIDTAGRDVGATSRWRSTLRESRASPTATRPART